MDAAMAAAGARAEARGVMALQVFANQPHGAVKHHEQLGPVVVLMTPATQRR